MNLDRHISTPQIAWIVGTLLGLAMAVFMGSAVGSQDFQKVILVLGAGLGVATFLILGKNYWMLIPLSLTAKFAAVPLGGRAIEFPELAIAGCSLFFVLRLATRKEKLHLMRAVNFPFLLFMAWVAMVFALNPIGLAMFGASTGGARFYIKLILAFAAFVIMSSRTYSEGDIKWIFRFIVFGAIFSLFYGIAEYATLGPAVDASTGMQLDQYYTWHQLLGVTGFLISFVIFANYTPREVFGLQRPFVTLVYILCFALVMLSGKRLALVALMLAPLVSAVMNRQYIYILVGAFVALGFVGLAVVGQGQWFKLPLVAQRTVSWLPGDWDPELDSMRGGSDLWRAELRYIAMQNIKRDPIIGRGFAIDISETMTAIGMQQRGGEIDIQVAAYALGRSWHNTWLGYAADFGIPLSVIQAVIWLTILIFSARCFRFYSNKSMLGAFALFVFIYTVRDLVGSHTGGHSALDAFDRWWMYGVIVALYVGISSRRPDRQSSMPLLPDPDETTSPHVVTSAFARR